MFHFIVLVYSQGNIELHKLVIHEAGHKLKLKCSYCNLFNVKWSGPFKSDQIVYNNSNSLKIKNVSEINSGLYVLEAMMSDRSIYKESVDVFIGSRYNRIVLNILNKI